MPKPSRTIPLALKRSTIPRHTMLRTKRITPDVWEISGGVQPSSNMYYLVSLRTLIDTGARANKTEFKEIFNVIGLNPATIQTIILTHFHYDHIGNVDLFKNAKLYASSDEISSYNLAPYKTTGSTKKLLEGFKLNAISERMQTLRIINAPGHTRGSICIYKEDDGILFTGDTLFRNGAIGFTGLPTSVPGKIQETLQKLLKLPYKELGPGHNLEDGLLLQQHH